jgi:hypothetical protein
MVGRWMCMEYCWNDAGGKTEELGEKLSQCHFVHHRVYMDWHEIEQSTP